VTNTVTPQMGFASLATSGAEELQKKRPNAKLIKAFNTVLRRIWIREK
jgi:predicted dinucleotide-binding enzyme